MNKSEYLESQRGKTYTQIIAEQPMETVVGSIRGDNLRDVVAILAAGLQYRLDTMALPAEVEPLRTALLTAFKYMTLPDYGINLSMPENAGMLQAAVAVGLVTQGESDKFFQLASYQRPLHSITREDCADYFGTGWVELPATDARFLTLQLNARTPEVTHILVQMQDLSGEWEHATALHGVQSCKPYRAELPYHGQARAVRWCCEYQLDGTVSVL